VPAYQNQINSVASLDSSRLFLFGPGIIKEWTRGDFDLSFADPAPAVLGVGDALQVEATLRNTGTLALDEPVLVVAWLSSDRFFGDGNDVHLGLADWPGAVAAPGAEATKTLSFELPNMIRPGTHHVILEIQLPASFRESNRANNVAISSAAVVTIPQWQLSLVTNGNGSVASDMVAEYYPHGARVSFMARPAKGARFAGWGGDAIGALSETMVVLDSNKTVVANFAATANLATFTRGGGTVAIDSEDGAYAVGATASLTALPLPGWSFAGWSGGLTGVAPSATLAMDANKVVTASFALDLEAWRAREFTVAELANPAISGADADPDGDGMANWREWLRGSPPKDAAEPGHAKVRREGNWLALTYTRLETMSAGYSVRCEGSDNLILLW
jgi:hypothetical protein